MAAFLYEEVVAYECRGALDPGATGPRTELSPNAEHLAVIEPGGQAISIVKMEGPAAGTQPHRFAASPITAAGKAETFVTECFTAVAWNTKGSKLIAAGSTGNLYVLDKNASLTKLYASKDTRAPWARPGTTVCGLVFLNADQLLVMTNTALLFDVPLKDRVEPWDKVRPHKLQSVHSDVQVCAIKEGKTLVVAGHGVQDSHLPGLCVSIWLWDKDKKWFSDVPKAWLGKSGAGKTAATGTWSITFGPGESVAVTTGTHRLLYVTLGDGKDVAMGDAHLPPTGAVSALLQKPGSVAFPQDRQLAIASPSGSLGVISTTTLANILGLQGDEPMERAPGTVVVWRNAGPDRGLMLVEPSPEPNVAWRLTVLAQRTPDEMLDVLAAKCDWDTAARLCQEYNFNADEVYRSRWAAAPCITEQLISECLDAMQDREWVYQQVLTGRCAPDADTQRALLQYGVNTALEAAQHVSQQYQDQYTAQEARALNRVRLRLLGQVDRLNLYLALHQGAYDAESFALMREASLLEVAQTYAGMGDVTALCTLLIAAPLTLGPQLPALLNCLPETLGPQSYSQLLPRVDGAPLPLPSPPPSHAPDGLAHAPDPASQWPVQREADWVESHMTVRELQEDGHSDLFAVTEHMLAVSHNQSLTELPPLAPEDVEAWYCERAAYMDITSRQLANAVALLDLGMARGGQKGGRMDKMLGNARVLLRILPSVSEQELGCDGPAWLMTLDMFASLARADQFKLIMKSSTVDTLAHDMEHRAGPFVLSVPRAELPQLLWDILNREFMKRPDWATELVKLEAERPRLMPNVLELTHLVCQVLYACSCTSAWDEFQEVLIALQEALNREQEKGEVAPADLMGAEAAVKQASAWVRSAGWLASKGIEMSLPQLTHVQQEGATELVQKLLTRCERTGGKWSGSDWDSVWGGIEQLHRTVLMSLPLEQLLLAYVATLLRMGKLDLANSYLIDGSHVALRQQDVADLVLGAARELLAGASQASEPAVNRAKEILALAPQGDQAAALETALIEALQRLEAHGISVPPAQVKQRQAQHGTRDGGASSADMGLELLSFLLELGESQQLASQLDLVLEVVQLLRLDGNPDTLAKAKLMIAESCARTGEWASGSGLVVGLVDEGVQSAATLAAQLACSKAGRLLAGEVRIKLLSFASVYASPQELPGLLDELMSAQASCQSQETQNMVSAAPDYQLRRALAGPDAPVPLPSYGDMPLAQAVLSQQHSVADAVALVHTLVGEGGVQGSVPPFAVVQRGLLAGIHSLLIRALLAQNMPPSQLMKLQELPPLALLQQVQSFTLSRPEAKEALEAAQALSQRLQAAVDSRQLRTVVPNARPLDLLTQDTQQRAEALLQQAAVAGQQAAGVSPDGNSGPVSAASVAAGQKLLDRALQLCRQYNVSAWRARLEFVCAAIQSATQVPVELRQLLVDQWQQLLTDTPEQGESAPLLLSTLSAHIWPATPSASPSHLSLLLAMVQACLPGVPTTPPTASGQLSQMSKLLDKAGNALKGLALRPLFAPLLRSALTGIDLPEPVAVHIKRSSGGAGDGGGGSQAALIARPPIPEGSVDPDISALIAEAQGAVYAFTTLQTAGTGNKVLKAVQTMNPAAQGNNNPEAVGVNQARVFTSLPAPFPYYCLLCKGTATTTGPAERLDDSAWVTVRDACAGKVPPGQTRTWLDFLFLGGKQPMSQAVAGRHVPRQMGLQEQVTVCSQVLTWLPECSASAPTQPGKPMPDVTVRLLQHYGRLLLEAAVASAAIPTQVKSDIQAEVRHATEQAVSTKGQSGASACSLLHTAISKLVQQGIPYASILALTAAALPTPPLQHVALQPCGYTADVSAPALLASQIDTTVDECLGRFKQGPAHSSGVSSSPGPAEQLQMVLQCLSDGEEAPEPHVSEARDSVRHSVVRRVTTCVEGLDTAQYSQPQVAELLRVHASLMSGEVWPGFQSELSSGTGGQAAQALTGRILLAATLSQLGKGWSPAPHVTLDDLQSTQTATACFKKLLSDSVSEAQLSVLQGLLSTTWRHGAALPQPTPEEGAGEGDAAQAEAEESVVPLHKCWHALLGAAARQGHSGQVVDILVRTKPLQGQALVSTAEALQLSQEVIGDGPAPDPAACSVGALVLGLHPQLATDESLQSALLSLYESQEQGLLLGPELSQARLIAACTLRGALLQAAAARSTVETQPADGQTRAERQPTRVEQALIALALRESRDEPVPTVLPAVVAQLCVQKCFTEAAALAAKACRWSTALRALGGTVHFLEHFLTTLSNKSSSGPPQDPATELLAACQQEWVRNALQAIKTM